MEEILASIRRIISEDDAPAEAAEVQAAPPPAPEPEPEPEPIAFAPEPQEEPPPPAPLATPEEDDVLELTDKVREPAETHGDIDVFAREAAQPPPPPPPQQPVWRAVEEEPLIADHAADSAASAFGSLARAVAMPADGRSIEDVVRELLRPLLKSWLDEHLPVIVQASVDAEVARIARSRGR